MASIVLTGGYAWDDGAITLSFARSLASHGEFALTAVSERVEGTSSLAFTFIMAAVFAVRDMGFDAHIMAGQLMSLAMLLATMFLLNLGLKRNAIGPEVRWLALVLFALNPMHLAEILNGMEMTLFGLGLTAFILAYSRRSRWAHLLIVMLLLTRFEAVFYLSVGLGGVVLVNREERRWAARLLCGLVLSFALITAARLVYFGDIMPNTIWAKMHSPYSPDIRMSEAIYYRFLGLKDFANAVSVFLVALAGLAILGARLGLLRDIKVWVILSFAIFALISGKNWGYDGRMFVGLLPVMVLAVTDHARRVLGGSPGYLVSACLVFTLAVSPVLRIGMWAENIKTIQTGAYHQAYVGSEKAAEWNIEFWPDEYGVTPVTFRDTGRRVDALRVILRLDTISFMAPDMGGLGLCCAPTHIRVLDLALLLNPQLAHQGYGALDDQLATERPDLIESHAPWTHVSGLFSQATFKNAYVPIIFENTLFWMRHDLLAGLRGNSDVIVRQLEPGYDLTNLRYFNPPVSANKIEFDYLRGYGVENILVLDRSGT